MSKDSHGGGGAGEWEQEEGRKGKLWLEHKMKINKYINKDFFKKNLTVCVLLIYLQNYLRYCEIQLNILFRLGSIPSIVYLYEAIPKSEKRRIYIVPIYFR